MTTYVHPRVTGSDLIFGLRLEFGTVDLLASSESCAFGFEIGNLDAPLFLAGGSAIAEFGNLVCYREFDA